MDLNGQESMMDDINIDRTSYIQDSNLKEVKMVDIDTFSMENVGYQNEIGKVTDEVQTGEKKENSTFEVDMASSACEEMWDPTSSQKMLDKSQQPPDLLTGIGEPGSSGNILIVDSEPERASDSLKEIPTVSTSQQQQQQQQQKDEDSESNTDSQSFVCSQCNRLYTGQPAFQCSHCSELLHLSCTDLKQPEDYTPSWTCRTCSSYRASIEMRSLNILQININGIIDKHAEIYSILINFNIHVALIQETNLSPLDTLKDFENYKTIRRDKTPVNYGLVTLIHNSIKFHDTTSETLQLLNNDNSFNFQSIKITLDFIKYNLVNIYVPPVASEYCPVDYVTDLFPLTQLPNLILGGNFNAHHTAWLISQTKTPRGELVINSLNTLHVLNHREQPTYTPNSTSPDITFCSQPHHLASTWQTLDAISSDHLPILITFNHKHPVNTSSRKSFTLYKSADWIAFRNFIEDKLNTFYIIRSTSLKSVIMSFNKIIQDASRRFIPLGHRKEYNPFSSKEVESLIKQRNRQRQNRQPNREELKKITAINDRITDLVIAIQKKNWEKYTLALNQRTDNADLFRKIRKLQAYHKRMPRPQQMYAQNNSFYKNMVKDNPHLKKIKEHWKVHSPMYQSFPFTPEEVLQAIRALKPTSAEGSDQLSNHHFKHVGPNAVSTLAVILNYAWMNNFPSRWNRSHLLRIVKPSRDQNIPTSSRSKSSPPPTISKVLEKLIFNHLKPQLPSSDSESDVKPDAATSTFLAKLSEHILTTFSKPSRRNRPNPNKSKQRSRNSSS